MKRSRYFAPVVATALAGSTLVSGWWYWAGRPASPGRAEPVQLTPEERSRVACGPVALAIAAQLSGVYVEPAVLIAECELTPKGASPEDLERLAAKHGLRARQVRWDWNRLSSHTRPVVLHVDGTHYVVAHPGEPRDTSPEGSDSIRIYEPVGAATWWSRRTLEDRWAGLAVVVEAQPSQDVLGVGTWWVDIGSRRCTGSAEFVVPVRNDSPDRTTLRIARTSCECTAAKFDRQELAPGDVSILTAAVNLEKKRGPFRERVHLTSQAGARSHTWCITLAGTSIGEIEFSAREVALGDLRPGDNKSVSIVLRDAGDASLQLTAVDPVIDDGGAVRFGNVRYTRVTANIAAEQRRRHPVIQEHDWLISFDVVEVSPREKGKVVGELRVRGTSHAGSNRGTVQMSCPIAGWIQ